MELKININIYIYIYANEKTEPSSNSLFPVFCLNRLRLGNLQFVALRWRFEALQPLDVHLPLWRWARRGIEGLGRAAK